MTPKEIVQSAFETAVVSCLVEEGFKYSQSQFSFRRNRGDFVQHISIALSHRNTQDSIQFWSAFNISSPRFNRWLKNQQRNPVEGYIVGAMDWNIPGWRKPNELISFEISNLDTRTLVVADWKQRCQLIGISYLNSLSDWKGAAEELIRWRWHHQRAADLFLIGGMTEAAIDALQVGLECLEKEVIPISENAHPTLIWKRKREAVDREQRKAEFLKRINTLRMA